MLSADVAWCLLLAFDDYKNNSDFSYFSWTKKYFIIEIDIVS